MPVSEPENVVVTAGAISAEPVGEVVGEAVGEGDGDGDGEDAIAPMAISAL